MASLQYRWGDSERSDVLVQPTSEHFELYAVRPPADTCVWRGDVGDVLREWRRWQEDALHEASLDAATDDPFVDNPFADPEGDVEREHLVELRRRLLLHVLPDGSRGGVDPFEPELVVDALLGEVPRCVRFRWQSGVVQSTIDPIGRSPLEVLVGQSSVWGGDVHAIVTGWAKHWVGAAAELWDCPDSVAAFLAEDDGPDPREYGARVRGLLALLEERAPPKVDETASLGHTAAVRFLFGANAYAAELAARCWAHHGFRRRSKPRRRSEVGPALSTAIWSRQRTQFADLRKRILSELTPSLDWSLTKPTEEQVCAALLTAQAGGRNA